MRDRVRFATANDTLTPANSSAFNGFTGPVPNYPTAADLSFTVTLAEAVRFAWRVRKCRWICRMNATSGTTPNRVYQSINFDLTSDDGHARERDLISQAGPANMFHFSTSTPAATLHTSYEDGSPDLDQTINLGLNGSLAMADDTGLLSVQSVFWFGHLANTAVPVPGTVVVGSVSIYGHDFDLYADPAANVTVTAASFEAAEYWPFAAADGSPIYDTATGDRLQDPRN